MKKIYFMLSAAILSAACARELNDIRTITPEEEGLQEYVFGVGPDAARTTFDGTDFVWTPGDRISIFDSALKNRRFETSDASVQANFTGRAKPSTCFYAFYPYDASIVMSEAGVVAATIPSRQTAKPGTICDGVNLSMGKLNFDDPAGISGSSFLMKNVGGYVKVLLGESSTPITSMKISAVGAEPISGDVTVDGRGDEPVTDSDGVPVIALVPENGSFGAGTYYAVANPTALSQGLRLKLSRKDYKRVELTLDVSSIVRNSARGTIFDASNPDALGWEDPAAHVIKVDFLNRSDLSINQPFDETVPTKSPLTTLTQNLYHLKETGEEFFICTTNEGINTSKGLRIDHNGYITLPALPAKRLSKVTLTYGIDSPTNVHGVCITSDADGASPVEGGEQKELGPSAAGQEFVWTLTGTEENTSYRLVNSGGTKELRIRFLDLEYIGFDEPAVNSVQLTAATINDNKINVSGLVNVQFPESAFIFWGVEYRSENSTQWTKGPSGRGAEFSAEIDGIDQSKVWYVRAYGRVDADANVYSAERKLIHRDPIVIKIDGFGATEYDGTATGGHWKFTGDRTGYTYPAGSVKRNTTVDEYSYYANPTDTEPLISGILVLDSNASKGYSFTNTYMMHYAGYVLIPGKRDYRISKVVCTIHASAGSGKNVTITTESSTSRTSDKLGVTANYSLSQQPEELPVTIDGKPDEGIKLWPSAAMYYDAIEITYAP